MVGHDLHTDVDPTVELRLPVVYLPVRCMAVMLPVPAAISVGMSGGALRTLFVRITNPTCAVSR